MDAISKYIDNMNFFLRRQSGHSKYMYAEAEYENVLTVSLTPCLISLENALRSFACLTREDLIEFKYNDKVCTTIHHNDITQV